MRDVRAMVVTLAGVLALVAVSGCRREAKGPTLGEKQDAAKDRWAIDSARMEADREAAAAPSELGGSTWRLVQLQSSHGRVFLPEPGGGLHRGVRQRRAGERRGWLQPGKRHMDGDAAQAVSPSARWPRRGRVCPPESMSARFLGDFQHMRSYQLVGGQLYISLRLMAASTSSCRRSRLTSERARLRPKRDEVIFQCVDSTGAKSRIFARFLTGNPGKVMLRRTGKTVDGAPGAIGKRRQV